MKKAFALFLCVSAVIAGRVGAQPAKPAARDPHDIAAYKLAVTNAYRKLFAAGMSNLSPEQLQTFLAVYADYEKEKSAIVSARTDLARSTWRLTPAKGASRTRS